MSKPRITKKSRAEDNRFALVMMFVVLLTFAFFIGVFTWVITPDKPSPAVVSETDAGRVLQAGFAHTFFPIETRTTVETDKGSFLVSGSFVALKDHALTLETRANGFRMLCDRVEKLCFPLVR